ncbi:hypothetical protein TSAR_005352 [Trichomalopsis sarcophagae]|uniref:Uncharacterized protein n=1 Tax=Trichomalopsis sarcophagae TaxID=543379 RepID=A0A232EWB4_9HYME|nr:hypothetical protein TSAR_005352 [Trichomalopsis sarcophagae]
MKGSTKAARFVYYPRHKRLNLNRRSHRTQLMFQAFEDDNRLVKAGCHIDSKDFTGETTLQIAVQYHRVPEAIQLIKLGANVHLKNLFGETPLHFAVTNKSHVDPLKDMIPNDKPYSKVDFYGFKSLNWALEARSMRNMLLNAKADVNTKDSNECYLHTGDIELVKIPIDAGADVNGSNMMQATALHDAVLCCDEAVVELLLNRGDDVALKTLELGSTALH